MSLQGTAAAEGWVYPARDRARAPAPAARRPDRRRGLRGGARRAPAAAGSVAVDRARLCCPRRPTRRPSSTSTPTFYAVRARVGGSPHAHRGGRATPTVRLLDAATEVARHVRCVGATSRSSRRPSTGAALVAQKRGARDHSRAATGLRGGRRQRRTAGPLGRVRAQPREPRRAHGATRRVVRRRGGERRRGRGRDPRHAGPRGAGGALRATAAAPTTSRVPVPLELGAHVRDHDVIPHDLGGYDA